MEDRPVSKFAGTSAWSALQTYLLCTAMIREKYEVSLQIHAQVPGRNEPFLFVIHLFNY